MSVRRARKLGRVATRNIRVKRGAPTVFISYSHDSEEHRAQVLALSERLRRDGIPADLDQYVRGAPPVGWPRWMRDRLLSADFVILICTEDYYRRFWGEAEGGHGASFEGAIVTQELYDDHGTNKKFIPVSFATDSVQIVPEPLRATTRYELTSEPAYQALYDFLLGQSGVEPASLGKPKLRERSRGTPLEFSQGASQPPQRPRALTPQPSSHTPSTMPSVEAPPSLGDSPLPEIHSNGVAAGPPPNLGSAASGPLRPRGAFAKSAWTRAIVAVAIGSIVVALIVVRRTPTGFSPACEPNSRGVKSGLGSADIQFSVLPGGSFTSCAGGLCQAKATSIKPFAISRTEISQSQFFDYVQHVRGERGDDAFRRTCWARNATKPASWRFPNEDTDRAPTQVDGSYPVVCITQEEAKDYVQWLGHRLGFRVRLPTALEWEYAATSGGKCRPFSWGDAWPPILRLANIADATARETLSYKPNEQIPLTSYRDGYAYAAPVGQFPPNQFGLFDMTGNVYEWVDDNCFAYGGSWDTGDGRLTESTHPYEKSLCSQRFSATGFRLVREL